jgi:hypothetical protein
MEPNKRVTVEELAAAFDLIISEIKTLADEGTTIDMRTHGSEAVGALIVLREHSINLKKIKERSKI